MGTFEIPQENILPKHWKLRWKVLDLKAHVAYVFFQWGNKPHCWNIAEVLEKCLQFFYIWPIHDDALKQLVEAGLVWPVEVQVGVGTRQLALTQPTEVGVALGASHLVATIHFLKQKKIHTIKPLVYVAQNQKP